MYEDLEPAPVPFVRRWGQPLTALGFVVAVVAISLSVVLSPYTTQYHAGYLAIRNDTAVSDAAMFYWFFPSQQSPASDPLLVWLQGGPGCSGLLGLFTENGPLKVGSFGATTPNPYSWNQNANLLYVDQPAGTGYSYANVSLWPLNGTQMADQLLYALLQFYEVYPSLKHRDLFLAGESYAGKYIPFLATAMMDLNAASNGTAPTSALKGLAIGDGWTNPVNQTAAYGAMAYNLGLIDENELAGFNARFNDCLALVLAEDWHQAGIDCEAILEYLVNATGGVNADDIRLYSFANMAPLKAFLNSPATKRMLHVPSNIVWTPCLDNMMPDDVMKPADQLLPRLLAQYRVLFYNGQFDLNAGGVGTQAFLWNLDWAGQAAYLAAPKYVWQVNGNTAGYVRTAGPLTQLLVAGAGHLVPRTQPAAALDMINRFMANATFADAPTLNPSLQAANRANRANL